MKLGVILISILLTFTSIALCLVTLLYTDWVSTTSLNFGLTSCNSCSQLSENWTWECIARKACELNDPNCRIYKNGYSAGALYSSFEIFSVLFGIILLEKLFMMLFNKNYGVPITIYFTSFVFFMSHITAVVLWFVYSEASFNSSSITATNGPKIAILNCVWMGCAVVFLLFNFCRSKKDFKNDTNEEIKPLFGLNPRLWILISFILVVISGGLIIAAISTDDWVKSNNFHGNLIRCEDCDEIPGNA